ncbi:MAG: tRNA 2-thiocytidine biosynthesis TtcA family protein [Candidatus Fimenecus sp.]
MQKLLSLVRAAVDKYNMIDEGDRIAVCVSGGKDSVLMLLCLINLKRFYPKKFELYAVTVDSQFYGENSDFSQIEEICRENGVEYVIKRTGLYNVIFEERKESNPCSLCARMRRGILHDTAKELGCNKIALGHHLDDAAETFIMNLFSGGRAESFSPVSYLSRKDLYMIRPMIFAYETDIERVVRKEDVPIVKSRCPVDEKTNREDTKKLLADLEKEYPGLRQKIVGAMERGKISGWHE